MLLWLTAALAADLRLQAFEVEVFASKLKASYMLDPNDHQSILDRKVSSPPRVMVKVRHGGSTWGQMVVLHDISGEILFGASVPAGSKAELELQDDGTFDALALPSGRGRKVTVPVLGGEAAVSPSPAPSTAPRPRAAPQPAPSSTPIDPNQALRAVVAQARAEEARARAEEQRLLLERQRQQAAERTRQEAARAEAERQAAIRALVANTNHPLTQACDSGFGRGGLERCVQLTYHRQYGVSEVTQCGRLMMEIDKWACIARLPTSYFVPAVLLEPCIDGYGPGPNALRCFDAVAAMRIAPKSSIDACASMPDRWALPCIQRFPALGYDFSAILEACEAVAPGDPLGCMSRVADVPFEGSAEVVRQCAHYDDDLELRSVCDGLHQLKTGGIAAEQCRRLDTAGLKRECMERTVEAMRTVHPPTPILGACLNAVGTGKLALSCFARGLDSMEGDVAGAVQACGEISKTPQETVACVGRVRRKLNPAGIRACAGGDRGAREVCLKKL